MISTLLKLIAVARHAARNSMSCHQKVEADGGKPSYLVTSADWRHRPAANTSSAMLYVRRIILKSRFAVPELLGQLVVVSP